MKKATIVQYGLSILLGVVAWVFWWKWHPELISFHEQNQLFLLTGDYLLERLTVPSGLADYVGEGLVQFFYYIGVGAAIIGTVLTTMLLLLRGALRHLMSDHSWTPWVIATVVTLLMWALLMDENTLMTYPVAICLALAAYLGCRRLGWGAQLVTSLALYWLVGPAFVIQAGLTLIDLWHERTWRKAILPSLVLAGAAVVWVYVCRTLWVAQFPWNTVLAGINYHRLTRFTCTAPDNQYGLIGMLFVLVLFTLVMDKLQRHTHRRIIEWETIVILLAGVSSYPLYCAFTTENPHDVNTHALLEQQYLVRKGDWAGLIANADQYNAQHIAALQTPLSANAVNLALVKTHQLGSRMFEFPQSGIQGLIMPNVRDNVSNVISMEAFWELGFVNEALRYAFDSQESIPNCRKSGRYLRRMAECNIVNGQYLVASKYIDLLKQSLFYSSWARQAEAYLYDEGRIANQPEWNQKRQYRLDEDFLYYWPELHKMLGKLALHNRQNQMAYDYFMASLLLKGDFRSYVANLPEQPQEGQDPFPKGYRTYVEYMQAHQGQADAVTSATVNK